MQLYGTDDNQLSPPSSHGSNRSSPTLASLQMDQYYGSSPSSQGFLGNSSSSSPNLQPPGGEGGLDNSNNFGEPPHKIFSEIAFEDLSASFKNLYKSVFDASQSGTTFGKSTVDLRIPWTPTISLECSL